MRVSIRILGLAAALSLAGCATPSSDRADSTYPLRGGEWVVEDIAGRGVIDDSRPSLVFGHDGRLSGSGSCNRLLGAYSTSGATLRIGEVGSTLMACSPALMDQERRFLDVLEGVDAYRIDATGALVLSTGTGSTITARLDSTASQKTTYRCTDGSVVEAWYPTTDTARLLYAGRSIEMTTAMSASGARYVGGGWEWWTKGMTEGTLSPLARGEDIVSSGGMICTAR